VDFLAPRDHGNTDGVDPDSCDEVVHVDAITLKRWICGLSISLSITWGNPGVQESSARIAGLMYAERGAVWVNGGRQKCGRTQAHGRSSFLNPVSIGASLVIGPCQWSFTNTGALRTGHSVWRCRRIL
jgi:hypothetical protein